jgi:hypothetical protein
VDEKEHNEGSSEDIEGRRVCSLAALSVVNWRGSKLRKALKMFLITPKRRAIVGGWQTANVED